MRSVALLATLCACGDNGAKADAQIDAPLVPCEPSAGTKISWRLVAKTAGPAMIVVSPPNDPRLLVVEQEGRIKFVGDDQLSEPFLDIADQIACCGEQGLLGLAFDPDYATTGAFYVFYTTSNRNQLARYHVSATDPNKADPTGEILLDIPDFASNHNAGMLEFGPDGYLYITTGDGGGGGDPDLNGQDTHALLAKMLRIDVHHAPYSIPADNPFADGVAGAPEVFHYGFRNPWRWAFDKLTGDLWVGDVGQNAIEEIDYIPAGSPAGQNFGWSLYEGDACYNNGNGNGTCSPAGITLPQFEINHSEGWCAIIGGDVYRGRCYPDLAGSYLFSDYCKGELRTATVAASVPTFATPSGVTYIEGSDVHDGQPPQPASIHAAAGGEMYMTTVQCCGSTTQGGIYRLEASP